MAGIHIYKKTFVKHQTEDLEGHFIGTFYALFGASLKTRPISFPVKPGCRKTYQAVICEIWPMDSGLIW